MQCFVLLISYYLLLNMQLQNSMMLFSTIWTMNHIHFIKSYWEAFWFIDMYATCSMILMRNEKKKMRNEKKKKKKKDKVCFFACKMSYSFYDVHLINTTVSISSFWAFLIFFFLVSWYLKYFFFVFLILYCCTF